MMAIEAERGRKDTVAEEQAFAHLRATPEERARILAKTTPFDVEAWQRDAVPPSPEELADLEEFLREREEMRQYSLKREKERLAELVE